MGSYIEINDTLRLTKDQGFPSILSLQTHLKAPYKFEAVKGKVFSFENKPTIRIFHAPPVRNFLVEFLNEKWIYWGHVHILSVQHDYANKTTSGTFKIIKLFSPEEMIEAHKLIDGNLDTNYFI